MEQTTKNITEISMQFDEVKVTLSGDMNAVLKLAKKLQNKPSATKKKTSINGAPMDIISEIVVEDMGEEIAFKHPDYKARTISKAVLELAEEKFAAKGADDINKTTRTEFVKVGEGNYPVGFNLIQAKNDAGL